MRSGAKCKHSHSFVANVAPTCSVRKSQACHCELWVRRDEWTSHPFAAQDVGVNRPDWPLGVALRQARERAGLSVRAAARRTQGGLSSGRWYQLESGYQKAGGHNIPVGTTPATLAAAATAINWDVEEAFAIAGFDPIDITPPKQSPLGDATDDELLAELKRRLVVVVSARDKSQNRTADWFPPGQEPRVLGDQDREERDDRSG